MVDLILDSGAFSAFTRNSSVDLSEYTKFAFNNSKHIGKTINLDFINPNDPEKAAAVSRSNFLSMRDAGVLSIPVFHARESLSWLDRMIEDCNYVGISSTSLVSSVEAKAWSRLVWNYISDKDGYPIVQTHSFGDTCDYSMLTFPFTSADSATWVIAGGRAGRIRINGKAIQFRTNKINDPNFISVDDVGLKRESWEMEIRELGLDPNKIINVKCKGSGLAMFRSFLVASDLLKLQAQSASISKYNNMGSLIQRKKQLEGGTPREGPVKLYYVISPSAYQFNFPVLAALGITNILVSYYYVLTSTKGFWEEKMLPFIYDPIGFCETDPRAKKFWDLLQECMLKD